MRSSISCIPSITPSSALSSTLLLYCFSKVYRCYLHTRHIPSNQRSKAKQK